MSPSTARRPRIAFLHTAEAHCQTFQDLMREEAPGLAFREAVDEPLLQEVIAKGGLTPELKDRLAAQLRRAGDAGAEVIVCSCSTLGGPAEVLGREFRLNVLRIDRGMAEAAVAAGPRVHVLACIDSTLDPTRRLLEDVADAASSRVEITLEVIPGAWAHFLAGDRKTYLAVIAQAISSSASGADVVVLAQASMAGAAELCEDLGVEVLTSPRLGLRRALAEIGDLTT
jgi:hypothetical protein